MDIILVPGLWLDASSWDDVVPQLEAADHRAHPLTLPGLESVDADRSQVSLDDQVSAVVAAIDACPTDAKVALVGHSLGCGIASIALDRRADRVSRVVYIGGWACSTGEPLAAGFATDGADLPMPDVSEFSQADLAGFDEAALAAFRDGAVPSPASLTTDQVVLTDEGRYDVPATLVCPEYSAAELQEWVAAGEPAVRELPRLADADYVDIDSGHWPQLTHPTELGGLLVAVLDR